jgi:hypothetical protein
MTAPPVPTVAAQDAWYELVVGNVNPSAADTVPNVTYLQPTGDQPGLTGSLDGEIIYLAGLNSRLDGGQKFLMWDEASLAVQDLVLHIQSVAALNPRNSWPVDLDKHPAKCVRRPDHHIRNDCRYSAIRITHHKRYRQQNHRIAHDSQHAHVDRSVARIRRHRRQG